MIDKLLQDIVEKECKDNDVAVLLSGGIDSNSLLFTANRLGKKVHCYTFHLDTFLESYDSKKAQEVCKKFNFDLTVIEVPTNNLENDFISLAEKYKCQKKTQYECTFPFMYVIPKIKEKYVISGLVADGHFGLSKKACLHYKHPKEKFDKFRKDYFSVENPGGVIQLKMLCKEYDKVLSVPYLDKKVFDYFIQFDWDTLNKPKEKYEIRKCFPEFNKIRFKNHLNLQLVSRVDKTFETLLTNKKINFRNRQRVMDICKDWYKLKKPSIIEGLV